MFLSLQSHASLQNPFERCIYQVTMLERKDQAGSKILISGGTRWYALQCVFANCS